MELPTIAFPDCKIAIEGRNSEIIELRWVIFFWLQQVNSHPRTETKEKVKKRKIRLGILIPLGRSVAPNIGIPKERKKITKLYRDRQTDCWITSITLSIPPKKNRWPSFVSQKKLWKKGPLLSYLFHSNFRPDMFRDFSPEEETPPNLFDPPYFLGGSCSFSRRLPRTIYSSTK